MSSEGVQQVGGEVLSMVQHRYLHDAEFHATVYRAVRTVEAAWSDLGMTEPLRRAATQAAGVAVILMEHASTEEETYCFYCEDRGRVLAPCFNCGKTAPAATSFPAPSSPLGTPEAGG